MDGMESNTKITREQKVRVALLFVFALLTVALAFFQMRNNVITPFVFRSKVDTEKKTLRDFQVQLQNVDTDQDGINDYDELNFHGTSPYLPDSDSDGKTDKNEIDVGSDPLCPEGQKCEGGEATGPEATSTPNFFNTPAPTVIGALSDQLYKSEAQAVDPSSDQTQAAINELMRNPEQIREMLRQSGQLPEEKLKQLSDDDLIKMLTESLDATKKTLSRTQAEQAIPPVTTSSTLTPQEETLPNP